MSSIYWLFLMCFFFFCFFGLLVILYFNFFCFRLVSISFSFLYLDLKF